MKQFIKIRYWLFLLVCLLMLGDLTPANGQDVRGQVLQRVNQVRGRYGLPAYRWNDQLAGSAQVHANWMAATELYRHTQTNGSTPYDRAVAQGYSGWVSENIVGGTNLTAGQAVVWWENSPVHFNGLISARYVEAGVGYAVSVNGQNMYVLVMGLPGSSSRANQDSVPDDAGISAVTPIVLSQPNEDGGIIHTVQTGQTAWAISARYEVQLSELFYLNGLTESSFLQPGDQLVIQLGRGQAPPPTPTPAYEHIVQEGETMWVIALRNGIDYFELLYLNQMGEETILRPGQQLKLRLRPGESPPPTPTPQLQYFVREGDTLLGVALRYGLTLDQLLALNQISANHLLQIGEPLWIRPTPLPAITQSVQQPATPPATFTPNPAVALALATPLPPVSSPLMPATVNLNPPITPTEAVSTPIAPENAGSSDTQPFVIGGVSLLVLLGLLFLYLGREQ